MMIRKSFALSFVIFGVSLLSGCNLFSSEPVVVGKEERLSVSNEPVAILPDPIQRQIEEMTLTEKIGQMVIVGVDGSSIDEYSKTMIHTYKVGGFILFKKNIEDTEQALTLINQLKSHNNSSEFPLFVSVDEEGGRVTRMPDEFLPIPSNEEIGKIVDERLSRKIGSAIAREIKMFGFNLNFAPVLDINSNPHNPVIGDRAFGTSPEIVSKLGIATMKGMQSEKVIPVAKHFPGHGDTWTDSHEVLPVLNHTLQRFMSFEMVPFREAIKQGMDVVMVAHILLPKVDAKDPASLSKPIITDLLRNKLQFGGVIITDDLTMGAITQTYDIGKAAVLSIQAGSDIILVCHDYDKQVEVLQSLKQAVSDGTIPIQTIDDSVYRILALKKKYNLSDTPIMKSFDADSMNADIHAVLAPYFK